MEVPHRSAGRCSANLPGRDPGQVEDRAALRIAEQDRGWRRVDAAPVALGLLGEVLLARFDEEVGDVERALPGLLLQQREKIAQLRIPGEFAPQDAPVFLAHHELACEEASRRMMGDEAQACVALQDFVGLDVLGFTDVVDPADGGCAHVVADRLGAPLDGECMGHRLEPGSGRLFEVALHEIREAGAQGAGSRRKSLQPEVMQVAADASQVGFQRRVGRHPGCSIALGGGHRRSLHPERR